jgi:hypothetical protein
MSNEKIVFIVKHCRGQMLLENLMLNINHTNTKGFVSSILYQKIDQLPAAIVIDLPAEFFAESSPQRLTASIYHSTIGCVLFVPGQKFSWKMPAQGELVTLEVKGETAH